MWENLKCGSAIYNKNCRGNDIFFFSADTVSHVSKDLQSLIVKTCRKYKNNIFHAFLILKKKKIDNHIKIIILIIAKVV